jgi:uncharacterized protein
MKSPFVFNVSELLHQGAAGMPEHRTQTGPSPSRIGNEMIAVEEGAEVTLAADLTMLGSGVLVDADVTAQLSGQCVRCLRDLNRDLNLHVSQVFSLEDDFVGGDDAEDEEEDVPQVNDANEIDLEQTVIDEAVLSLPFNPACEGGCDSQDTDVPAPDGVSEEQSEEERVDPRWAGLEKFL